MQTRENKIPGINHIEIWVSNLNTSLQFYKGFLELIGWKQINLTAFATPQMEIYLTEMPELKKVSSLGIRHICFQATKKEEVDIVANHLKSVNASILRGPIDMNYSEGYYTIDFHDPDGLIIEVAYTPNMNFNI